MCAGFIRKDDWDIPGNGLLALPIQVSDYSSCCVRCQTTLEFKAYTCSPSTKECWLKRGVGNGDFPRSDRISGFDSRCSQ